MGIETTGVIGAGVIGIGVAHSLAQAGYSVIIVDISDAILERAKDELAKALRFQRLFKKKESESANAVISRIQFCTDHRLLANADFVVENVTEDWPIKKLVYQQIDPILSNHCILAANTSAITITRLAGLTSRPTKVLGIHFMNPVHLKTTVELIKGYHTSQETLDAAVALLASMGKEAIIVNDAPGFISNRVLMLSINEAVFALQDGVASAEQIDRIFKTCFGHKMGLLETADLIGLDTVLRSIEVLYDSFNDSKYRPCPLLRQMVHAGLLGRKSGRGFYTYEVEVSGASLLKEV
jgi:3-hydroxybutyryl-CoA dehydrogenase